MEAKNINTQKAKLIFQIDEAEHKLAIKPNSLLDGSYTNKILSKVYVKDIEVKNLRA